MVSVKSVKDMPAGVAFRGYTGISLTVAQMESAGCSGEVFANPKTDTVFIKEETWKPATSAYENSRKKI